MFAGAIIWITYCPRGEIHGFAWVWSEDFLNPCDTDPFAQSEGEDNHRTLMNSPPLILVNNWDPDNGARIRCGRDNVIKLSSL